MLEINNINLKFKEIQNINLNSNHCFKLLNNRIDIVKDVHKTYLNNKNDNILLFGIDALQYQISMLEYEYNTLLNMYKLITNKVYSQYYKLFKMIINYIDNLKDFKESNKDYLIYINNKKNDYPIYKDLELFKNYDFNLINSLQLDIIDIIEKLKNFVDNKEIILKRDEEVSINGINIGIFVNAIQFDILTVKQNIEFYKNYLHIFNIYHRQYYTRLNIRLLILLGQINSDVKFEKINKYKNDEEECAYFDNPDVSLNIVFDNEISILQNVNLPDELKEEFNIIKENLIFEDNHNIQIIHTEKENDKDTIKTHLENTEVEDISYNLQQTQELKYKMEIYNADNDIGDFTTEELKSKWNTIMNDIIIERDYSTTTNIDYIDSKDEFAEKIENSINLIESDKDEIDKWREIINNKDITQDEKNKLKSKLKKRKRKHK